MEKRIFNSELFVKLRNQKGWTQQELLNAVTEIGLTAPFKDHQQLLNLEDYRNISAPNISMRTIREIENSEPVDINKGIYLFELLGHRNSKKIYDSENFTEYLPLTEADLKSPQLIAPNGYLLLEEVKHDVEKTIFEAMAELLSETMVSHYYIHLGNYHLEDQRVIRSILDLIYCRFDTRIKRGADDSWLHETKSISIDDLMRKREIEIEIMDLFTSNRIKIFHCTLEQFFDVYEVDSLEDGFQTLLEYEQDKYSLGRNKKMIHHGPHRIEYIGLSNNSDNLRINPNNGKLYLKVTNSLKEEEQLFEFSKYSGKDSYLIDDIHEEYEVFETWKNSFLPQEYVEPESGFERKWVIKGGKLCVMTTKINEKIKKSSEI